jgi:hypothetical protein
VFWRGDVLAVSGFDEDCTGWGTGEDFDIGTRLYHLGRWRKFIYGCAIMFHLKDAGTFIQRLAYARQRKK